MNTSAVARPNPKRHVLIDIGHPAHVHLFRHFAQYLKDNSIPFLITSRDKEITNDLLDHYELDHITVSKQSASFFGQFFEFLVRTVKIIKLHRRYRFRLAVGTSVSIGFLSLYSLGKVKSFNFCEDDDDIVPLQAMLAYPGSTNIVNPNCIRYRHWKKKRILLPTYHELAYLHPDHFEPNPDTLKRYGLTPRRYIIVRLSSLKAHHDRSEKGISADLIPMIKDIANSYRIIESIEISTNRIIDPWDMHDVLAFAKVLISDSQTMTAEAALLGVPSIRISSFKNRLSYLDEIESCLVNAFSYYPDETESIIACVEGILGADNSPAQMIATRNWIGENKINLAEWMKAELGHFEGKS